MILFDAVFARTGRRVWTLPGSRTRSVPPAEAQRRCARFVRQFLSFEQQPERNVPKVYMDTIRLRQIQIAQFSQI